MSGGRLDAICAARAADVARLKARRPHSALRADLPKQAPRGFLSSLVRAAEADGPGRSLGLIAEIKRASPSKGVIRAAYDPPALARAYERGGATCLSVLTEERHFQGSDAHLVAARKAVGLPVIRKDFTVDPYQAIEARVLGADAILLILAALSDAQAAEIEAAAREVRLDVLIEVHDEHELDRALALRSPLIGINNRDLATFEVDLSTTERLVPRVPGDRLVVAESGVRGPADVERLARAGAHALLVGESLMRSSDVARATAMLMGRPLPETDPGIVEEGAA